jgi:hypothetical protein
VTFRSKITKNYLNNGNGSIEIGNPYKQKEDALKYWANDNSGAGRKPHPNSNVASKDRIYHPNWKASHKYLSVKNSNNAAKHIQSNSQEIMGNLCAQQGSAKIPYLRTFFLTNVSAAMLHFMCGQCFLTLNPDFLDNFWIFDDASPAFLCGFTKMIAPQALKARDRCVERIEKWHAHAT